MWYQKPTLEQELAACALVRAQISLFTPIFEPLYPQEPTPEWKIQAENFLLLLPEVDSGTVRALLDMLTIEMRRSAALQARLENWGIPIPFVDPTRPEYSAEATTEAMLKWVDGWMDAAIESELIHGSGNNETAA